jgi:hypothetical protein
MPHHQSYLCNHKLPCHVLSHVNNSTWHAYSGVSALNSALYLLVHNHRFLIKLLRLPTATVCPFCLASNQSINPKQVQSVPLPHQSINPNLSHRQVFKSHGSPSCTWPAYMCRMTRRSQRGKGSGQFCFLLPLITMQAPASSTSSGACIESTNGLLSFCHFHRGHVR